MRLLLYGGTFDPPHNGHLNNLRAAAQAVCPDEILVMPAGVPPHKAASHTPAALRLEMCGCFAALPGLPPVAISDWEVRRAEQGIPNYSVDTLQMLAEQYPAAELYLAVGSDMLLSFSQWRQWQTILRLAALVCVSRESEDAAALQAAAEGLRQTPGAKGIVLAKAAPLPMASSALRGRLAAGDPCVDCLPPQAARVIAREGLYRQCENQ